ncbi:hypothetical protein RVBP20_3150 [Pseudomonas phage sp. NK1]|nr:hypothetical protein RVBP20_3150 [Pseudomonas phage sp. NK1]
MKNTRLVEVAQYAYSLVGGKPLDEDMDDCEREYWASIPEEDIALASNWIVVSDGPLYDLLKEISKVAHERLNPYPGGPTLKTDVLETFRLSGLDEVALIWKDVCITWYQYPGRCMTSSRQLTDEEFEEFKEDLTIAVELP